MKIINKIALILLIIHNYIFLRREEASFIHNSNITYIHILSQWYEKFFMKIIILYTHECTRTHTYTSSFL